MDRWHGYFALQRLPFLALDESWYDVLASTVTLEGVGGGAHQQLQIRGSLDTVDYLGNPLSGSYLFECDFAADAVSFAAYRGRLANVFGIDPGLITLNESNVTFGERQSALCVYSYLGNRLRVALFGCHSDDVLCTWEESRRETVAYIINNPVVWEP